MKRVMSPELDRYARQWLHSLKQSGRVQVTLAINYYALLQFDRHVRRVRARPTAICEVTEDHVLSWKQAMVARGLKLSSLDDMLGPVCRFFHWLEKTGRIFVSPCKQISPVRIHRALLFVPTPAQMLAVLRGISGDSPRAQRDRAIMEMLYGSGLRRREVVELTHSSIDFNDRIVRVFGKGRERIVPITRAAARAVREYCENGRRKLLAGRKCKWLWISANTARPLQIDYFDNIARRHGRTVGVPLGAQTLRRAFATHLLARGASLEDLRLLLGHAGYEHLHHYLRYTPYQLIATHSASRLGR